MESEKKNLLTWMNRKGVFFYLVEIFLFCVLALFFFYPLFLSVKAGLEHNGQFSFYWLNRLFSNSTLMGQLLNSFLLACVTTFLVILLTLPMAILSNRFQFKGQGLISFLLLIPLILPPFVGALSIKQFLGQFGILNSILQQIGLLEIAPGQLPPDWLGKGFIVVALLQMLHLFPIMYLNLNATLANLDPAYSQAARNLGASGLVSFWRVTLPLLRPGLFAGGSIVFIWSFTDIGTPLIVGYEELASVKIFKELAQADVSGRTYSLVLVMLFLSVLFYAIGKIAFGKSDSLESAKASVASSARKLGPFGTFWVWLFFGFIIFVSALPHIGVILQAFSDQWIQTILPESYTFRHIRFVLEQPDTRRSILNSLFYASISTTLDIFFGAAAAWVIIRKKLIGSRILDIILMLPLAVPGVILAAGYIAMTAPGSIFEGIGPLRNPVYIIIIAYSIRRIPFVVRGVCAGLQQIPVTLEHAAKNLGASQGKAIFRITIPLIIANIIAAGLLTFSFAMLEVSDSLVLAQTQEFYPITKEIYTQALSANIDANNIAASLGVIGMIVLGGSLGIAAILLGKRLGAIFRA